MLQLSIKCVQHNEYIIYDDDDGDAMLMIIIIIGENWLLKFKHEVKPAKCIGLRL